MLRLKHRNNLNKINKIDKEGVKNIMDNLDKNNFGEIVKSKLDKQKDEFSKKLLEKRKILKGKEFCYNSWFPNVNNYINV